MQWRRKSSVCATAPVVQRRECLGRLPRSRLLAARISQHQVLPMLHASAADSNQWVPHPDASVASAFRTSDWDKPNCRAIRESVMPALKAARTAFTCPRVNETATASGCRCGEGLSVGKEHLPLRLASASAAASSRSSSSSSRCLTALGRSLVPPLRRRRDLLCR
jgi:hypothetical protein